LRFAILTAARTGEVIGARWSEIDARVWTIPAERMKGGRPHRIPLADEALAVLERLKPLRTEGGYVFPGAAKDAPLSNMALAMTLRKLGRGDLTVHGFRSTFRDWAADRTGYENHVVEMALAHTVGGVEGAYRRGDLFERRRRLMADWATHCLTEPPATADNVRRIGEAR